MTQNNRRSQIGFGSTYSKEQVPGKGSTEGLQSVLGGQSWRIRPEKKATAAHPCLWMAAGVAKFKDCNNYYDCTTCKYDTGMHKKASSGKQLSWQDAMRRLPELHRVCRHSLTGRIANRACAYDYQCSKCDFDQYFEEVLAAKIAPVPEEIHQVKGFAVPMNHFFHNGHAWARIESGGNLRIGMDDFALKLLGAADAFDLPLMGKELDPGAAGWGLRRKDNQADVLSPVGGVIVEVNAAVREKPQLANSDPFGEGWLFLLRTGDIKKSMGSLKSDEASINWMNTEVGRLENMVEEVAGPLAADGGYLASDIYGNLPDLGWQNLTRNFLQTG